MTRYRRAHVKGGTFFFTVPLAERPNDVLVKNIDSLRTAYRAVQQVHQFETIAVCILPDHTIWSMPDGDADFSIRWSRIKWKFSRALPAAVSRSQSKIAKRD